MKNKMAKALSVLVVLCLLSTTVFAAGTETVIPRYTYVANIVVGFGIEIDGRAYCHTGVGLHESTHSCSLTMVLQRNDGSGWDNVKTWSGSGGEDYDIEEYWYVDSGYEYRTANTIRVYNASGRLIETITTYSEIWEY